MTSSLILKPAYAAALEAAYGAPSQIGFGSAVFFEHNPGGDLDNLARTKYKYFVGDNWERFGEAMWMRQWKQVYVRRAQAAREIVTELRAIPDAAAKRSVPMILEGVDHASKARQALSAAYDDPTVSELSVFDIGDGEAMFGILIAGRRANGETTCLVFLLD